MRPRRWLKAALLATTILGAPALAHADPITLVGFAATAAGAAASSAIGGVLGAVLGAAITGVIGFAGNQLFGAQDPSAQVSSRVRQFDPHPAIRFPFGEFPLEGSTVFHHVDGELYYAVYLLGSIPCDSITRIEINDGLHLPLQDPDKLKVMNDPNIDYKGGSDVDDSFNDFKNGRIVFWFGDGEHTQPPQLWIDEIGDVITATDIWKGVACMFVRIDHSSNVDIATKLWTHGKPPPLRFFGKWSKLYDPRKDPNSGVTQYVSGSHDFDDPTTWEWSDNAALAGLMLATHRLALGISTEVIPIQQWADAADDCGSVSVTGNDHSKSVTFDDSGDVVTRAAGSDPGSGQIAYDPSWNSAGSLTVTGGNLEIRGSDADGTVTSDETVRFGAYLHLPSIGLDPDLTYGFDSVSTLVSQGSGLLERQIIAVGDGIGQTSEADQLAYSMPPNAGTITVIQDTGFVSDSGLGPINVTGPFVSHTGYKGAANSTAEVWSAHTYSLTGVATDLPRFAVNGLVTIKQRELELLDPVLACMAGHLDTTDGLLGVRAGVWVAPTETLAQPIGDEVEVKGARDAGFDTIRATFIGPDSDWSEEDGPGYVLRSGNRVGPLPLPLVSSRIQAHRLEKIAALRAEPRITVDALWDGQQAHRRIGERVNFSLSGLPRSNSSFVVVGKEIITRALDEDGAFELSTRLTLQEDLERTYAFATEDVPDARNSTILDPVNDALAAPTSVTLEQSDYRSAAGATARLKITVAITQALSGRAGTLRVEVTDGSGYTHLIDMEVSDGTLSYVAYLKPAEVGVTYTARARAESAFLGVSDYTTSNSLTIVAPVLDFDPDDFSAEFA